MSGELVLPFYILGDVSFSMTKTLDGMSPLAALNQVAPAVKDALYDNPILADKVRFSLIDFSDEAVVQIPMGNLLKVPTASIPTLTARGGTSFRAAFDKLRSQIESDVRTLKADGDKVHRPAVFFVTDGEPTDGDGEWERSFAALTDPSFPARPNVIPFGVGEARKEILDRLVHPAGKMRSFIARDGVNPAIAIRQMAEVLISSIISSATSVDQFGQGGGLVIPDLDEDDTWI